MPVNAIMPEAMAEYIAVAVETLMAATKPGRRRLSIRGKLSAPVIALTAYIKGISHALDWSQSFLNDMAVTLRREDIESKIAAFAK